MTVVERAFGAVLALTGGYVTLGLLYRVTLGPVPREWWGVLLVSSLVTVAGIVEYRWATRRGRRRAQEAVREQLLLLGRDRRTLVEDEIPGLAGVTRDEAIEVLRGLQREGAAEIDADAEGRIVYRFPPARRH